MKDPEVYLDGPGDEIPRRSREERLQAVFDLIAEAPPATDTQSAYNLVKDSLHSAEKDEWQQMEVHSLDLFDEINHKGKVIRCDVLFHHFLFLGQNGAIEIRVKDNKGEFSGRTSVSENTAGALERSTVVFSKLGADSLGVWE